MSVVHEQNGEQHCTRRRCHGTPPLPLLPPRNTKKSKQGNRVARSCLHHCLTQPPLSSNDAVTVVVKSCVLSLDVTASHDMFITPSAQKKSCLSLSSWTLVGVVVEKQYRTRQMIASHSSQSSNKNQRIKNHAHCCWCRCCTVSSSTLSRSL